MAFGWHCLCTLQADPRHESGLYRAKLSHYKYKNNLMKRQSREDTPLSAEQDKLYTRFRNSIRPFVKPNEQSK